jgi:hypothetical protein
VKIVAFEAPSATVQTWRHYYLNAHNLLFVVDQAQLAPGTTHTGLVVQVLREIDQRAPVSCQLMVVFSKSDLKLRRGEGEAEIVAALQDFSHDVVTIRCSAASGEGIDRISQSALRFSNRVRL